MSTTTLALPSTPHPRRPTTASPPLRAQGRPVTTRAAPTGARGPADDDATLERMCEGFATLYLEVETGLRPRRQLQRLLCPRLYAQLADVVVRPDRPRGHVGRVLGSRPAADRYEAVVTVRRSDRTTALALGLRRGHAGWRVEALDRPEEGPLPQLAVPWPDDADEPGLGW